jgi:hypothetical protein
VERDGWPWVGVEREWEEEGGVWGGGKKLSGGGGSSKGKRGEGRQA